MKFASVLLAVGCCLSAAGGQWFEGFITLPDSLKGVKSPECLAYDSATNTVWVGGRWSDRLLAIDSDSNRAVAGVRLPGSYVRHLCGASESHTLLGSMVEFDSVVVVDCSSRTVSAFVPVASPGLMLYSPTFNKVYCASDSGAGCVAIIDASTNRVIRNLPGYAMDFCEDTRDGWIYCAGGGAQTIAIIDGATDDLVARFNTGHHWPKALCYSTKSDRVYCAHDYADSVLVMHRDTVLGWIRVGDYPVNLCYNSVNNRVYSANWSGGTVSVIDCSTSQVTGSISVGGNPEILVYDSLYNRLYCTTGSDMAVIDGQTNVILRRVPNVATSDAVLLNQLNQTLYYPAKRYSQGVTATDALSGDSVAFISTLGAEKPKTVCWSSVRNKVYVACQGSQHRLGVIDGFTGSILGWVPAGSYPCALAYDSVLDRVYCANNGTASVTVVDCGPDTVVATVHVGNSPVALLCSPDGSTVYCVNRGDRTVSAVDAHLNSVLWTANVGAYPCAIAYGASGTKLYCADSAASRVSVIDPITGSVLRTIQVGVGPRALAYSPASDRLYCVNVSSATVSCIDCDTDSVVKTASVPNPYGICYYPPYNRVLCSRLRLGGRIWYYLGITAISCATNNIDFELDLVNIGGLFDKRLEFGYNAYNCEVYCRAGGGGVYVLAGGDVVGTFGTQGFGGGFAWNERQNRMYAACENDSRIAVIRDAGGGVEEGTAPRSASQTPAATIISRMLFLPEASNRKPQAASLLDIAGREVLGLQTGPNDVRALAPGVYFVRSEPSAVSGKPSAVHKVVIAR